ncbi:protein of unknown function [Paraburkholderia kururiensis]
MQALTEETVTRFTPCSAARLTYAVMSAPLGIVNPLWMLLWKYFYAVFRRLRILDCLAARDTSAVPSAI